MSDYPRVCPRCRELLGEKAFSVDRSKASGHKSHCRACDRDWAKRYYEGRRDELRARRVAKRSAAAEASRLRRAEERRLVLESRRRRS